MTSQRIYTCICERTKYQTGYVCYGRTNTNKYNLPCRRCFFVFLLRSNFPYKRYSSTDVPPSTSKHLSISFCRVIKFSKPQHEEHFPGWIVKSQSWVIIRCRVRCSPTRYVILAVGAGRRCADDAEVEAFEEDSWK